MKGQIIVINFQARWRGKNEIRVPGRFVELDVDGHHQIEVFQRAIDLPTVWSR